MFSTWLSGWSKLPAFYLSRGSFSRSFEKSKRYKEVSYRARSFRWSCQNCLLRVLRNIFEGTRFSGKKIFFCLFFQHFAFFQFSVIPRALGKRFWGLSSKVHSTCPNSRFGRNFQVHKLIGVELKRTEQLCACFSIWLSKMPFTFPEDQFGREVDSKSF